LRRSGQASALKRAAAWNHKPALPEGRTGKSLAGLSVFSTSTASSFETHRFAMLLMDEVSDPHGEERVFARLEP
jgi:hypothetical protein